MIDKNDLEHVRKGLESFDEKREMLIKESRSIVKLSKIIIYALQRGELKEAEKLIEQAKKGLAELEKHAAKHEELRYSGSFKIAEQELVEAMTFLIFLTEKRLATKEELNVSAETYLLGIFDLTGELVRKAINSAINKDFQTAIEIKDFVSELYGELLKFGFGNGPLRKSFDSIKYNLKKLEDLVYDLKIKGLI